MHFEQPKPDSKKYSDLISEIQKGIIKIPKFQREFVWSIDKTAKLLDSILKGYPIGTFILWQTDERINDIKNVGNLGIPPTPEGNKVQYVLDGQQRITSLKEIMQQSSTHHCPAIQRKPFPPEKTQPCYFLYMIQSGLTPVVVVLRQGFYCWIVK